MDSKVLLRTLILISIKLLKISIKVNCIEIIIKNNMEVLYQAKTLQIIKTSRKIVVLSIK